MSAFFSALTTPVKSIGVSILTSMTALDVLAEPVNTTLTSTVTDSDTKKLLIAGLTSIITQVLLKLIENAKKRKLAKRAGTNSEI